MKPSTQCWTEGLRFVQIARPYEDIEGELKGAAHVVAQQFAERNDLVMNSNGREEYHV
jgi:hypothetical protein